MAEKVKKAKGDNHFNIRGPVVNHIMCDLENQALITMCVYLEKRSVEIVSLVFDGLMVHKKDVEDELLEGCMYEIIKEIGVDVRIVENLTKKQFDITLEPKEMNEEASKPQEDIF